jgi:hypothetical protein
MRRKHQAPNELVKTIIQTALYRAVMAVLEGDEVKGCLQQGMQPPLIVVAVAPSGNVLAVRFVSDKRWDLLDAHIVSPIEGELITVVVADQRNGAAKFTFQTGIRH